MPDRSRVPTAARAGSAGAHAAPPVRLVEGYGRRYVIFWFAVLTALAGATAWLTMMTGFEAYDDEGALMISVKQSLAGMRLYSQVFSCYGPVYYFYQWALRTVTATPVTHDVVRLSSLLPWLAVALLAAWVTLRLTRSLVLAAVLYLIVSQLLAFFGREPGHPQELALLLFLALAAAAVFAGTGNRRTLPMLALGVLPAALLLVKINAGAFAMAAVGTTLAARGPRTRVWRALGLAAAAVCTAIPFVLMRNHLDAQWARSFCWLEVASVAGCVCGMLRVRRAPRIALRDCLLAAAGFAFTVAAVMAILQAQGVSMFSVYDALLVAPSRIFLEHRTWFRVPPSMKLTAPWALLGLGSAAFSAWKQPLTDTPAWRVLFAGKTVFCAVALAVIVSGRPVLPVVIPFAWLLLFNPNQADDESQSFPRSLLSILTVLQSLYAYPVAGNQAQFIQILLWITLIVCVGDSLSWLAGAWRPSGVPVRWVRIAATAALVAVALLQVREGVQRFRKYRSLPSLDLPGARLVHVSPGIKADQRWLVGSLQRQCDSFESYPGLRSLNFWTGIEPLTGLSIDNWAQSFSPDQEQRVAAALSGHPQACVVYNPRLAEFWNPGKENLDNHPLVGYIFRNFQPVSGSGDYQLMLRSERVGKAALPSR